MGKKRVVTVFGSSAIRPGDAEYERAEALGRALAEAGYAICNGGYMGSMEASAKGAREAGGEVIGITTGAFPERSPNPYLTSERRQPTLLKRIEVLIETGDAYVVLPGGIGTIAELMLVWNLVVIRALPPRPILLYGEPYRQLLEALGNLMEIGPEQLRYLKVTAELEEILHALEACFRR